MTRSDKVRHRVSYHHPGHAHALTFSCYHRFPFLKSERCCEWLKQSIDSDRDALKFQVWAYCFMPDDVHLIVWPLRPEYKISEILSHIKMPVSRQAVAYLRQEAPEWLPRLEVRKGSEVRHQFWQKGGGFDRNITEPKTLILMLDYIHQNPVRKGLVERARDWKWSSAAWFEESGDAPLSLDRIPPEWLLI